MGTQFRFSGTRLLPLGSSTVSYIDAAYKLEKTLIGFRKRFTSERNGSIRLNRLGRDVSFKLRDNRVMVSPPDKTYTHPFFQSPSLLSDLSGTNAFF